MPCIEPARRAEDDHMEFLLGPILFIMDVAPVNKASGIALTFTLLPLMALVIFRRRVWAAFISVIAFLFWLFIGIVGQGINV